MREFLRKLGEYLIRHNHKHIWELRYPRYKLIEDPDNDWYKLDPSDIYITCNQPNCYKYSYVNILLKKL